MTADIYQYLIDQEQQHGAKEVRDACRRYMMRKTYAGLNVRPPCNPSGVAEGILHLPERQVRPVPTADGLPGGNG